MVLACLVLLLCCLPHPAQALGEWSLCADTVWSGWGTTCCGENNLWAMGYCGSGNLFASSCAPPQVNSMEWMMMLIHQI